MPKIKRLLENALFGKFKSEKMIVKHSTQLNNWCKNVNELKNHPGRQLSVCPKKLQTQKLFGKTVFSQSTANGPN